MENAITDMLRSSIRHPKPFSVNGLKRTEGGEAEPLDMEDKSVDIITTENYLNMPGHGELTPSYNGVRLLEYALSANL